VALSLPDGVFRVQTLEFDELPPKAADRERLIRWRLEKSIAFDSTDTFLRYQVLRQQHKGFTVLACVAKQAVISQYESLLAGAGLEPWSVGLSSFYTLNFYSSLITSRSAVSALAHITEDSFATIIMDADGARFYRYKEMKRTGPDEMKTRFMREIDDSLHFYTHRDRAQQSEVKYLYLAGESSLPAELAAGLRSMTSLNVEVLSPAVVIPSANGIGIEMAAALGAGSAL
jgi:Tfp pilus assembly PilM family ATPase